MHRITRLRAVQRAVSRYLLVNILHLLNGNLFENRALKGEGIVFSKNNGTSCHDLRTYPGVNTQIRLTNGNIEDRY